MSSRIRFCRWMSRCGTRTARDTRCYSTLGASSGGSCQTSRWGGQSRRGTPTRSSSSGSGGTPPGCRWPNRSAAGSRSARPNIVPSIPPSGRCRRRLPELATRLRSRYDGRSITRFCNARSSWRRLVARSVGGDAEIGAAETTWMFTPHTPWGPHEYHLVVRPMLEDPAGNRIGRSFEVDSSEGTSQRGAGAGSSVPFLPKR